MSIEEKAKAYDEALEHFKSFKERYYTKDTNLGDVIFDKTGEMQKDFEEIFPQLRESEDERIRKALILHLQAFYSNEVVAPGISKEMAIAYLEKQKEQKPIQSNVEKEYIRTIKSLISDFIRGKREIDTGYYQKIYDWLDGRHIEQKSISQENFDTAKHEALWDEQKPVEKQDYSGLNDLERAILRSFLVAGVENIPVTIIKETAKECLAQINPIVAVDAEQLLKILPQKPAWSEEDEIHVRSIFGDFRQDVVPDEEDQDWLKKKIEILRSSWKPSEEQMEALQCAIAFMEIRKASDYDISPLKELYEQLKKL